MKNIEKEIPKKNHTYPMKWFYYIVYFQLYVIPAFNILRAIIMLSEEFDSGLKNIQGFINILYAVINIFICVFDFFVRSRLMEYKANAPKLLLLSYGISCISNFAFGIILNTHTTEQLIGVIIGGIILILTNHRYFSRRKELFVN